MVRGLSEPEPKTVGDRRHVRRAGRRRTGEERCRDSVEGLRQHNLNCKGGHEPSAARALRRALSQPRQWAARSVYSVGPNCRLGSVDVHVRECFGTGAPPTTNLAWARSLRSAEPMHQRCGHKDGDQRRQQVGERQHTDLALLEQHLHWAQAGVHARSQQRRPWHGPAATAHRRPAGERRVEGPIVQATASHKTAPPLRTRVASVRHARGPVCASGEVAPGMWLYPRTASAPSPANSRATTTPVRIAAPLPAPQIVPAPRGRRPRPEHWHPDQHRGGGELRPPLNKLARPGRAAGGRESGRRRRTGPHPVCAKPVHFREPGHAALR